MSASSSAKIVALLSLILSIYGTYHYPLNHYKPWGSKPEDPSADDPFFGLDFTPFTSISLVIYTYWIIVYIAQINFVARLFQSQTLATETPAPQASSSWFQRLIGAVNEPASAGGNVNPIVSHFVLFNILHFCWTFLFVKGHLFLSLVLAFVNLLQITVLYLVHDTKRSSSLSTHIGTASLTFSWLMYVLFWNGSLWLGTNGRIGRILANAFIWDFLIIDFFLLIIFRDWSISLAHSYLLFGIGMAQMWQKIFSLQWIFAFIISALLFLGSIWAATDNQPVVSADTERAGLLSA